MLAAITLPTLALAASTSGSGPGTRLEQAVQAVTGDGGRSADLAGVDADGGSGAGADSSEAPVASRYTIRPGDTLSRVAALHGVPEVALAERNELRPPFELRPGDRLAIPAPDGDQPPPPHPRSEEAPEVAASISRWADANDLSPSLLAAMTWHESRWRKDARSEKGAVGVGQVLPTTATWVAEELVGEPLDPRRIDDNVRLSARYLRWLIDRADGDHAAALASYYQGESSVAETGWYDDTDDYVAAVFDLRWRFRAAAS